MKPPRHVEARLKHREVWLTECLNRHLRRYFQAAGYTVPEHVRVSTGFPSRGALAKVKRVIGQAWSQKCSADGSHEIIISITLQDEVRIIGILVHELIHVTVGVEHGHKKPFVDAMIKLGLEGKPTATTEGEALVKVAKEWAAKLGPYPGASLSGLDLKKQATRLLLMECECGLKIRTTQKWIEEYGPEWGCPCGETLVLQD